MSDGENAAAPGNLDLALIGNCRLAALLDNAGRMVWLCFPRFDADPVFSRLLSGTQEKGFCDVLMADLVHTSADYVRNTAILETVLEDKHGGRLKITDYAPRFSQYERIFRPPVLIRRISPLSGSPRIAIRVRPTHGYGKICGTHTMGSNHIRYLGGETILRLTTDAPLSYIVEETVFRLSQDLTLVFGPDEPFQGALSPTGHEFEDKTRRWWQHWVRSLAVPLEWQSAVTRAAIAL
jgi:GH15 family glucan-1,4-alpha-glucosidase